MFVSTTLWVFIGLDNPYHSQYRIVRTFASAQDRRIISLDFLVQSEVEGKAEFPSDSQSPTNPKMLEP